MTSAFIKNLFAKCKMHGGGDAQVIISNSEVYALICMTIRDLDWSYQELGITPIDLPNSDYYQISLNWFEEINFADLSIDKILTALDSCVKKDNDFSLYIENFSALHRRRAKYKRILSQQPLPTTELSQKFISCGGEVHQGEAAWLHMEQQVGSVISVFIEKYIKPAIQAIESVNISDIRSLTLNWDNDRIVIFNSENSYSIDRV